jgi:hypothetical protein
MAPSSIAIHAAIGGKKGGMPVVTAEMSGVATPTVVAHRGLRRNAPASTGRYIGRKTWPRWRA